MPKVESAKPLIEFDAFLKPISADRPSGEPLVHAAVYDQIREARRARDTEVPPVKPDFQKVIELVQPELISRSKDLQLAVWLGEALTNRFGFAGLRDGLKLVRELQRAFWDTIFPLPDGADMEARTQVSEWLATQLAITVKLLPIAVGDWSFFDWQESTKFDLPDEKTLDSMTFADADKARALARQAADEHRKTGAMWRLADAATNRMFCEVLALSVQEAQAELAALQEANDSLFTRNQIPVMTPLRDALADVARQLKPRLEAKRVAEPDPSDDADGAAVGNDGVPSARRMGTGVIQSRRDALDRLNDVALYFQMHEPHSPVSYLVQRAATWGQMPLDVWLADVIKDDGVLFQLRQTLGFNTSLGAEVKPKK